MTRTRPARTASPDGDARQQEDPQQVAERLPQKARAGWRAVGLPSEHGGWSLTLEPVLLGLLVAWSLPGLLLGIAALLAFTARTPFKVVLVDRWRHRRLDRTRLAARLAAAEIALIALLVLLAATSAGDWFWVPLVAALPLVGVELWFDMRSRSRRLVPELAGSIGISAVATAIALAGGLDGALAVGLWCVVAARAAAAIPYARTQILRARRRPHQLWHSDLAQTLGVVAVAVGWLLGAVTWPAALAILAVAGINTALVRMPPRPAVVIGIQQTIFGVAVIAVTAVSVLAR